MSSIAFPLLLLSASQKKKLYEAQVYIRLDADPLGSNEIDYVSLLAIGFSFFVVDFSVISWYSVLLIP
jgi:hypothetical protein